MICFVIAMAMGVMAETANTVEVTKFHQSYPYSGKATVEYTVGGTLPANAFAEITLNTDDASATFTQSNIVTGANTFTIDFASSFGGALLLTNASFVVTIAGGSEAELGGVQLWENGPYWAERNVGASKPEDYGYYFWWGDTVGYTNTESGWISVKDGTSISFSSSGAAGSTCGKDNSALQSAGYIDSTGNLVAAYDAVTAHLGSPWRMPTDSEFSALANNCTTTWITTNGVSGYLVTGTGKYANRSIFLPAAASGYGSNLDYVGTYGWYWSSTPFSDSSDYAWCLFCYSSNFVQIYKARYLGKSVRPVRGLGGTVVVGIVTYDLAVPVISPESGMTFVSSLTVSISCETEGAAIYYTTDGSEPTKDSTAYRRFKIYGKTTVKAVAYDAATGLYSGVTTADYALGTCANPVIAPSGGSAVAVEGGYVFYRDGQTVAIAKNGEEGTIRYTFDGTEPTAESGVYSGAITLDATTMIKAKVFSDNYFDSETVTVVFVRERTIGDAMGAPYHAFTTSGDDDKPFYRVADVSAPNGEAMHSGDIGNSGAYGTFVRTVLSTTVMGPGTVSFSWKASCEDDAPDYEWDHGEFAVDGVIEANISGETGWTNVSVAVTGSGEHTLTWTYLKDDAEYEGEDCICVAGYGWASAEAYTHTTVVPVPYEWLAAHDPGVVDEYEAYEAAANKTAANGRMSVAECYALGLDPQNTTNDFKIVSFPMKTDGTPDLENIVLDPPEARWNVQEAQVVLKCAEQLEGPWRTVTEEVGRGVSPSRGGSPGTARPTIRFFKAVVLLGDAQDDLDDTHDSVQLWEGGPYWATTNIGAEKPEDYGYYFWWGDTIGYKLEDNYSWVASDGSSSNFSFSPENTPTCYKDIATLQREGWIVSQDDTYVLAPSHDAAHMQWGDAWRMPTIQELSDLNNKCDWTWTTMNGISGCLVSGRGNYAANSIFLPYSTDGSRTSSSRWGGFYWSSVPFSDNYGAWYLGFAPRDHGTDYYSRDFGQSVRPVRRSAQ